MKNTTTTKKEYMSVLVKCGEGPIACSKDRNKLLDKMGEYPDGSTFHIYCVDHIIFHFNLFNVVDYFDSFFVFLKDWTILEFLS